jgi:nucleotide-binding universal stress UspA family protein
MVVARTAASFWGGISNVVFSTDFSKISDTAFDFACATAKAVNGELHLFHPVDISTTHMGTPLAQDVIEKQIREARQRMRGRYVSKLDDFKDYSVEAWEGIPYVEVVKYAREQQADLLVLGHDTTPSSSDEERLQSDIEQIMVRANCPVVVLKRAPIKKS